MGHLRAYPRASIGRGRNGTRRALHAAHRALIPCALLVAGCGAAQDDAGSTDLDSTGTGPVTCSLERGLLDAAEVLADPEDPCHPWLEPLHGRAVRVDRPGGSGSLWSRRTMYGTGIMTTAAHVLSPCWAYWSEQDDGEIASDGSCPQMFHDPEQVVPGAVIRIGAEGGGVPASWWSAHFALYNPFVPPDEYISPTGLPRYDVSVYAVDSQVFETYGTGLGIVPEPIVDAPLELHDPAGYTLATPTWAAATGGQIVLALGFPDTDGGGRSLHASVGRVLDAIEAEQAIATLRDAGDEEGQIAYDGDAEFLFEGTAAPGMSGGGVFDEEGRQVGIIVRASFADIGVQYVRAVRMSYLVLEMERGFSSLPTERQIAVAPYLEAR